MAIILGLVLGGLVFVAIGYSRSQSNQISRPATTEIPASLIDTTGCTSGKPMMYRNSKVTCGSQGAPTLVTCGLGTPTIVGTDTEGIINTGTGVLSDCTINFSTTLGATPRCVTSGSVSVWISAVSPSSMTFTGVTLASTRIWYFCWGT